MELLNSDLLPEMAVSWETIEAVFEANEESLKDYAKYMSGTLPNLKDAQTITDIISYISEDNQLQYLIREKIREALELKIVGDI